MNDSVGKTEGWPPPFTLDQERILNLLTGDRFYSNASAALREALLNSIDAVNRRARSEPELHPRIEVTFARDSLILSVSDNGDGMDRAAVSTLFTRIGASASQMDAGRGSVGEFGIGVISYFMAGDVFSIQTFDGSSDRIGLRFARMMLAGGAAEQIEPTQELRGTTVTVHVRDAETFELLLRSYSHWCRDVIGLVGTELPSGRVINQGGSLRPTAVPGLPACAWIERAHLGPVSDPAAWDAMSGVSRISVLYRGIFVQEFEARGLWGIEGSIDVDPKHFKPRLNREGFVGSAFAAEVEGFLRSAHPIILAEMARRLSEAVDRGDLDRWSERRWATLWLSIPRDSAYENAARAWDGIFRRMPVFELAVGNKWEFVSVENLVDLKQSKIFVAPHPDDKHTEIVNAALRLLRLTGRAVIRGLRRDAGWMTDAPNYFNTTADLIINVFARELPDLLPLGSVAETVLAEVQSHVTLYGGSPSVELVKIGADGPPLLRLPTRLLLNIEHPIGRTIVEETLAANSGPWSLITVTARHSQEHISQVAAAVRNFPGEPQKLGLVKRRFVKNLLS